MIGSLSGQIHGLALGLHALMLVSRFACKKTYRKLLPFLKIICTFPAIFYEFKNKAFSNVIFSKFGT